MEFRDLKEQYLRNKKEMDHAIQHVLMNSSFIGGEPVKKLEERLADYVGVKHCVTCANGTDALQLALMAWGVGVGDAVFVPDFTFFSSGEVVPWLGATPVFVDVEKDTFNISVTSLKAAVQKVLQEGKLIPRVVIAVDLFGQPADYTAIREVTKEYGLLLLEDGAQGFGGSIGKRKACGFGDISTTSFFPAKPLGCYGDGGAVFTDCDEWAELIRSLCVHGKGADKYDNVRIGLNSRLDTLQAAILTVKLDIFQKHELDEVHEVAEMYHAGLRETGVVCPKVPEGYGSSWAQYTIQLEDQGQRDLLMNRLREEGIPSAIYYKKPMHLQKAFADLAFEGGTYENTNYLCDRVLSLPMHPYLGKTEVDKICDVISKAEYGVV